ncbi:MAG: acyl esterase [Verrucomicrobiaceae bacterium]|nr:acyl esterase [Verrucomicrobiaceae bacterium]
MVKWPEQARCLDALSRENNIEYSICTLVNKPTLYHAMVDSFIEAGFSSEFCEYLFIDNSGMASTDAYLGLNQFLASAQGKYIILCHQDILLKYDNIEKLNACIARLNSIDPYWALLGNAGGVHPGRLAVHIHDRNTQSVDKSLVFPIRVHSLDENFILVRHDANLGASADLTGFHLYGLDLCLQAVLKGHSAYVIEFYLMHTGEGLMTADFKQCQEALIKKYCRAFSGRFLRTTCTILYISGNSLCARLFNTRRVTRWVKHWYRKFSWAI